MSNSWEGNIHKFSRKLEISVNLVIKKLAIQLFELIVLKTPVDTGRARASWNLSNANIDIGVAPPGDYSLEDALNKVSEKSVVGMARTIWITNSLPYILALEHGHSQQAPTGMVALSVEEIESHLDSIVRELS